MTIQETKSTGGAGTQKTISRGGRTVSIPVDIPITEVLFIFNRPPDGLVGTTGGSGKSTVSRPKCPWYNPFPDYPVFGPVCPYKKWHNTPRN